MKPRRAIKYGSFLIILTQMQFGTTVAYASRGKAGLLATTTTPATPILKGDRHALFWDGNLEQQW